MGNKANEYCNRYEVSGHNKPNKDFFSYVIAAQDITVGERFGNLEVLLQLTLSLVYLLEGGLSLVVERMHPSTPRTSLSGLILKDNRRSMSGD
jgi:hypothetical protein